MIQEGWCLPPGVFEHGSDCKGRRSWSAHTEGNISMTIWENGFSAWPPLGGLIGEVQVELIEKIAGSQLFAAIVLYVSTCIPPVSWHRTIRIKRSANLHLGAPALAGYPNVVWRFVEAVSYPAGWSYSPITRCLPEQVLSRIQRYYLESYHTLVCWVVSVGWPSCPNSGHFNLACQADTDPSNHDLGGLGTTTFYNM